MSFLFGQRPQPSSAEKIAAAESEIEMVSDMYNRLVETCTRKCIPPTYREADLNKGESVCLDRCVAKFFEVNVKVSEKMQGEAATTSRAGGAGGMGGGFGM
ncbi:protein transporter tim10 [Elasticomyces elasticus]|nr:protein transporter tim10 [Elasticomyces elasticus]